MFNLVKPAYAVDLSIPQYNPLARVSSVGVLMNVVGPIAMGIGGFICLMFLLWGGFLYLTSGGEPEKVQQGKRTLTYAIIGLIVMVCSVLFVNIITYVFGVNSFFKK